MTEQARIRISFDRESICMGDDSIDHRIVFELPESATVADLLIHLKTLLPSSRGKQDWRIGMGWAKDSPVFGRYRLDGSSEPRTVAVAPVGPAKDARLRDIRTGEYLSCYARYVFSDPAPSGKWLTFDELRRTPGFLGAAPVVVQGETPYHWKQQS